MLGIIIGFIGIPWFVGIGIAFMRPSYGAANCAQGLDQNARRFHPSVRMCR
jgi:hypothetical protein